MLDEIFSQKHRIKEERPDSFAEEQARYAKETADHLEALGEDLFQALQGNDSYFSLENTR